jgi:transketolase
MNPEERIKLEEFATDIRKLTLKAIASLGVGHVGGAMSIVDVLAVLYDRRMKYDPKNPQVEERDRLVLSKGHAGPALYAVLALKGFFEEDWLFTLNRGGTNLPSHCDRNLTPGIDMTTGSLGQGLSAACGIALGNVIDKRDSYTYCIIGDGESNEGQNWEAAMFASQYKLNKLIAFTDYNKMQIDGYTNEIMDLGDIEGKWKSFGWNVMRVNGHDYDLIDNAILQAQNSADKPTMIVLDTIKGRGCSFAEGDLGNHNMPVNEEQLKEALAAL